MIKVVVWNENHHEKINEDCKKAYPHGIHGCIQSFLTSADVEVTTATLDMENCGLSQELLDETDVLIWWGHMKHHEVPDEIVAMVHQRVLAGMGLIVLHSGHHSKIFRRLMGTSCNLQWRDDDRERIWCVMPSHPIAKNIPISFEIAHEEMYGEPFAIPTPDELVFIGWFSGGEVFRSGVTYRREHGKIFYFQPGHETHPTYENIHVQNIIRNAVRWAAPDFYSKQLDCPNVTSPEASGEAIKIGISDAAPGGF